MTKVGSWPKTTVAQSEVLRECAKMEVLTFRRPLCADAYAGDPSFPTGLTLKAFVPERHVRNAWALLNDSYADGAGQVQAFDDWWGAPQADAEYDADLCFVVEDEKTNVLAGFAQCWMSAFIKDIAVAPSYRGRGVARALLQVISTRFAARGHSHLGLKVVSNNAPAISLYRSLGFDFG